MVSFTRSWPYKRKRINLSHTIKLLDCINHLLLANRELNLTEKIKTWRKRRLHNKLFWAFYLVCNSHKTTNDNYGNFFFQNKTLFDLQKTWKWIQVMVILDVMWKEISRVLQKSSSWPYVIQKSYNEKMHSREML